MFWGKVSAAGVIYQGGYYSFSTRLKCFLKACNWIPTNFDSGEFWLDLARQFLCQMIHSLPCRCFSFLCFLHKLIQGSKKCLEISFVLQVTNLLLHQEEKERHCSYGSPYFYIRTGMCAKELSSAQVFTVIYCSANYPVMRLLYPFSKRGWK